MSPAFPKKVIVIEDDAMLERIFERLLVREQFEVTTLSDTSTVLDTLTALPEKPALIVLDLMMSGISGFDILETLRKDESWKNVPIAVVTNLGGKENEQKVLALGANLYLIKSENDPKQLVEKLRALIKVE